MVFATDDPAGDKIMRSVYRTAADRFLTMRRQARARRRDRHEWTLGSQGLSTHVELVLNAPLRLDEIYQHTAPETPYGPQVQDSG